MTLIYLEAIVGTIEERQLEKRFAAEYRDYKRRVRKWFPYWRARC